MKSIHEDFEIYKSNAIDNYKFFVTFKKLSMKDDRLYLQKNNFNNLVRSTHHLDENFDSMFFESIDDANQQILQYIRHQKLKLYEKFTES
jgi:hypothetical protein